MRASLSSSLSGTVVGRDSSGIGGDVPSPRAATPLAPPRRESRRIDAPSPPRQAWPRDARDDGAAALFLHRARRAGDPPRPELRAALLAAVSRPPGVLLAEGAAGADRALSLFAARRGPRPRSRDRRRGR